MNDAKVREEWMKNNGLLELNAKMDTTQPIYIEMKLHQYVIHQNSAIHSKDENKSEIALHHFSIFDQHPTESQLKRSKFIDFDYRVKPGV